jgi:hypothetical protein
MSPSAAPNWIWAVGPWDAGAAIKQGLGSQGGQVAEIRSASARSLKIKLLDPSEASFTCWGYSSEAAVIDELISDLWVYRNGSPVFRGRITGPNSDTLAPDRYDFAVEARDYREVLNRRILYADRTWTGVEQSTIVWDLITDTEALGGGNLGLTQGTWPVTGIIRPSVTFMAGDSVGQSIKLLSQMSGGFDWDIDIGLNANLYYPYRGQDNGTVLDWGGVVKNVTRTFEPSQYANGIRQSGADGITPTSLAVPDIGSRAEGRWDAQFSDTQLNTTDMVNQTAATNLALAQTALPTYQIQVAKGAWGGPGHIWIGDYVTVAIKAGRLNEVVKARVFELDITVDDSNREDVTVVLGNPVIDPRSVLRGIGARLAQLTKR